MVSSDGAHSIERGQEKWEEDGPMEALKILKHGHGTPKTTGLVVEKGSSTGQFSGSMWSVSGRVNAFHLVRELIRS